jgi:multidrug efflux pump subunit AcrA (membrane-fusion protein)
MPENQQHSQQVSVLLGTPPSWLVRWGTAVVFVVVAATIIGAAFVRYPDVITGQMIITATNPVSPVYAHKTGRITEIFVQQGDTVAPDEWLLVIQNTSQTAHVQQLLNALSTYDSLVAHCTDSLPYLHKSQWQLGELQQTVTQWRMAYSNWANFTNIKIYPRKLEAMKSQLVMYHQYYERSWSQRLVMQEQHDLAEARYFADSTLAFSGVIAPLELKQRKEEFLNRKFALHGARSALAQLQIQMRELEKQLAEVEAEFENLREQYLQNYHTATAQVKAAIKQWLETNVLVSTVAGQVQFQAAAGVNSLVQVQRHVVSIEPLEKAAPTVMVTVPPARASKLAVGQRVQGKLDAFPFEEFGMLIGEVAHVNTAPAIDADGNVTYTVLVSVPEELQTAFGQTIATHRELHGLGEIVTEELSVLDRLLFQLRRLWGR